MKIVDLEYTPVFVPIEAPLRYSQGAHPGFSRIIVQLKTDEGLVGLGECYGGKAREGQLDEFRASLRGEDPFQLDPHWYGGIHRARVAAQVCETFSLDISMHSGTELGISQAAMLHPAAVLPNLSAACDSHYHHLLDDVIKGGKLVYENGSTAFPTEEEE